MLNKQDILKYNDFMSYYNNPIYADKNVNTNLTERFFEQICLRIFKHIKELGMNTNQYFNLLLSYNYLRSENTLGIEDFVLAILQEPYNPMFSQQQLEFIFKKMDTNKDNSFDRKEFKYAITKENNCLL